MNLFFFGGGGDFGLPGSVIWIRYPIWIRNPDPKNCKKVQRSYARAIFCIRIYQAVVETGWRSFYNKISLMLKRIARRNSKFKKNFQPSKETSVPQKINIKKFRIRWFDFIRLIRNWIHDLMSRCINRSASFKWLWSVYCANHLHFSSRPKTFSVHRYCKHIKDENSQSWSMTFVSKCKNIQIILSRFDCE